MRGDVKGDVRYDLLPLDEKAVRAHRRYADDSGARLVFAWQDFCPEAINFPLKNLDESQDTIWPAG